MTTLPDIGTLLGEMASALGGLLSRRGIDDPAMIGIHTGGLWVAKRLHEVLHLQTPLGALDISFYRDDFSRVGVQPTVRSSRLPFDVDDRTILLVDDVLYTGRTIRAALNEIFDYGRPAAVLLIVLVDRGGRELPIAADVAGCRLDLPTGRQIKLHGPEPLVLRLQQAP